jgi:hypothetical protein
MWINKLRLGHLVSAAISLPAIALSLAADVPPSSVALGTRVVRSL